MSKPLGYISALYESGNNDRSVGTISYNKSDPGGKSYGKYQIATRTGTLKRYIAWSTFNSEFQGVHPASKEFDAVWKRLAEESPEEFEADQFNFIKTTHYDPVYRVARDFGFDVDNRAIQEALFSIGVQHGGYRHILKMALQLKKSEKYDDLTALYEARKKYVSSLSLPSALKDALLRRYEAEIVSCRELAPLQEA